MREWSTNDQHLQKKINSEIILEGATQCPAIQSEDQSFPKSQFQSSTSLQDLPKVPGIPWDNQKDELVFAFESLATYLEKKIITKKVILSTIAKIFDPLGVLSPIFIVLKILFQRLRKEGVDWDVPVDNGIWRSNLKNMNEVCAIPISRWYLSKLNNYNLEQSCVELHRFGDPSEKAYGAVVYIRAESSESVVSTLVTSNAKIARIAGCTIPRLELLFAVILGRLISSVQNALCKTFSISRSVCWLDSEIALSWITQPEKEFKTFIQNRVVEIRRLASPEMWQHVPSKNNPEDLVSRGCNASRLKDKAQWWEGPNFLKSGEELWPVQKRFGLTKFEDIELKKEKETTVNVAQTTKLVSTKSTKFSDSANWADY